MGLVDTRDSAREKILPFLAHAPPRNPAPQDRSTTIKFKGAPRASLFSKSHQPPHVQITIRYA